MNMNLKEMVAAGLVQRVYIQYSQSIFPCNRTVWAVTQKAAYAVGHYENSRDAWVSLREANWKGGAYAA